MREGLYYFLKRREGEKWRRVRGKGKELGRRKLKEGQKKEAYTSFKGKEGIGCF